MSIETINSQITSLEKDIASVEKKIAEESQKESSKQTRILQIRSSITKNTSASSLRSKSGEIDRLNKDIAGCIKNRAKYEKQRADKSVKLNGLRVKMRDEEQKARKESQKQTMSLQRQYKDLISDIQSNVVNYKSREQSQLNSTRNDRIVSKTYDVFISHASEDKDDIGRPLAQLLTDKGLAVFFDEMSLAWGDSLRRKIDEGIANSRFGIVIVSHNFFAKEWPQKELDGFFSRQMSGEEIILPIWHNISKDEMMRRSPMMADILGLSTAIHTLEDIASKLAEKLNGTSAEA